VNAKVDLDSKLIEEFDKRAKEMKDAEYDKLEVVPCDVKAIQNTPKGISDFWVKALLNHPLGGMINEKDRPVLGYLTDISLELHDVEKGEGYDLIFTFAENSYFEGTEIRKELHMKNKGMLDKTICTEIKWKDNASNPTLKKQKKKRKGKKVTVEVKADSFFNFFDEFDPSKAKKPSGDDEDDEDGEEEM
jgi:predicted RNA methylase